MDSSPSTRPVITFVIPALNVEATLDRCLDAIVAAAAGHHAEVLVIDNGSTDRTVAIARARGVHVVTAPGFTVAALRNLGVRLAAAEIVAFVDADCVIAPSWVARALPHFDDATVGAVGAATDVPDDATWVQRAWRLHRHRTTAPQQVEWLPTENLAVRKAAFEAVGGFDARLVTCEDVDLCYRLGASYRIVSDPALGSIHLGEAPTLARFFRKEAWRGRSNLRGVLAHGVRLSELPSVLLPLYHLAGAVAVGAGLVHGVAFGVTQPLAVATLLLAAPSLLLAGITATRFKRPQWWPALVAVYATYGAARALAIVSDVRGARARRNLPLDDVRPRRPVTAPVNGVRSRPAVTSPAVSANAGPSEDR